LSCPICNCSRRGMNLYCWDCGMPIPKLSEKQYLRFVEKSEKRVESSGAEVTLGLSGSRKGRKKSDYPKANV